MRFADFFNALLEGKVIGQKCLDCGSYTCPPKATCDNCASRNLEAVELSGKGVVRTFTTTYVAPSGYTEEAPYTVAMVELDEGPWIVGRIDLPNEEIEKLGQDLIGARVSIYGKEFPTEPFYPDKKRRVVPMFKVEGLK
ncbi:MAG: Zn-ribbon domain-containing OB-fold protein [Archaeoglobus sp.]|uniref:Zn-ribbon domain-containing OB-fold protein n=1 Tax=Archaeoglobus sp. TaxID=1872626 RepID=UPI001D941CC5|nr:Zn-ribbon domain-containing OB-fold protein [Archaeoglobus sp.]MBO8179458.1 Zn-ribbon domain-containing OB-fold protein [Archaeoglobus sp.]